MSAKPTVAVVGATGYAGRELAHLVVRHPSIDGSVFFLRAGADGERRANCLTELYPELRHVAHTNFCDIGFSLDRDGKRPVFVSCLDNLGKGAAGQAVQNMNTTFGLGETEGLV